MALIFSADDGINGRELWITNGTAGGTRLLKNIGPGAKGSAPKFLAELGGNILFEADDGAHGREIWITDGTTAGTRLLKDINPGGGHSAASGFTLLDGKLYFSATDGKHGQELWVTDGTSAGTKLVKDIRAGGGASAPASFVPLGHKLVFPANDGTHGQELWITSGTAAGTHLLADIRPGSATSSSTASWITPLGKKLLFSADDGKHGVELWMTDGTAAGTKLLKDINPVRSTDQNLSSSFPTNFLALNGKLIFQTNIGLWTTDGTPAGTKFMSEVNGNVITSHFVRLGKVAVFLATADFNNTALWVTDGTAAGTQRLAAPNQETSYGADFSPQIGNKLVFAVTDRDPFGETTIVGNELWVTDGTVAGTHFLKDINPGIPDSNAAEFTKLGNRLVFTADNGVHGRELWVTDGTAAGTKLIKDIKPGKGSSSPTGFAKIANKLVFTADDGVHGRELWITNGTAAGTQRVKDIKGLAGLGSDPDGFVHFNARPTGISISASSVPELTRNGAIVGNLSTADFDRGGTYTYKLLDDADGRFRIHGNELSVANGLKLDYEQATSHKIVIRSTDPGGKSVEKSLLIHVGNVTPETITGNASANTFVGGTGDDVLAGLAGNDTLAGRAGHDILTGGKGRDVLTGGTGKDDFIFNTAGDTGKSAGKRDVITDFQHTIDHIDLSAIDANGAAAGNGTFKFLTSKDAAFTGIKGQLRWFQENPSGSSHDRTIVEGDINGDKKADFQIELTGLVSLTKGDFIL